MTNRTRNSLLAVFFVILCGWVLIGFGQGDFNPWSGGCAVDGQVPSWSAAASKWVCASPGGGSGLPSGAVVLVVAGACPSGYIEENSLNGKTVVGTLAGNSDVGAAGGSDSVTPAGSVSQPTFAGGSDASSSVTAGTPAGSVSWPASVPTQAADTFGTTKFTTSGSGTAAFTSQTARGAISWPAGVPTFAGSALGTHQHSTTATGTVSQPSFTGTQFDNRSAFVKVIFCKKS